MSELLWADGFEAFFSRAAVITAPRSSGRPSTNFIARSHTSISILIRGVRRTSAITASTKLGTVIVVELAARADTEAIEARFSSLSAISGRWALPRADSRVARRQALSSSAASESVKARHSPFFTLSKPFRPIRTDCGSPSAKGRE